jgi:aryl-alcohol dehydrogenase-like predicted oxidoreductase
MNYVNLGGSGLKVSRLTLGCMTYGDAGRGDRGWVMNEQEGRPFISRALELGINFFDTANVYSLGASEEILGRAIRDMARRDEVVIATKVCARMRDDANGSGLSRKAIMTEIDASLRRLGTDYVDLYQIHRFDYTTPLEETLEALHDVVKAGKARYIGASSMAAWQFMKALGIQRAQGWTRFVSMQNQPGLSRGRARDDAAVRIRRGRGDSVVATGARSPHAAVDGGAGDQARPDRQVHQGVVSENRRHRSSDYRTRDLDCLGARRAAGASGAGLGAEQVLCNLADRRGEQAAPFGRCGRDAFAQTR